jgi:1A family penicillin-binding protein
VLVDKCQFNLLPATRIIALEMRLKAPNHEAARTDPSASSSGWAPLTVVSLLTRKTLLALRLLGLPFFYLLVITIGICAAIGELLLQCIKVAVRIIRSFYPRVKQRLLLGEQAIRGAGRAVISAVRTLRVPQRLWSGTRVFLALLGHWTEITIRVFAFLGRVILSATTALLRYLLSILTAATDKQRLSVEPHPGRRFPGEAAKRRLFRVLRFLPEILIRFFLYLVPQPRYAILGALFTLPFVVITLAAWTYILRDLPPASQLTTRTQALTTRIYDRKGRLLFKFYKNENRTLVPLAEIPLVLRQGTIAIEDKDFYSHPGISVRGVIRALWSNTTTDTVSGGSTITQQLVKNALLTPEQTWRRKIREAILSIQVELTYTKDQILEMYLNQVPYGGTTYGVAEASDFYFHKRVQDLTLAEAAYLAGLPASPTQFSPYGAHPELAKERQAEVLSKMVELGYITRNAADEAYKQNLPLQSPNIQILAPHFVMYVKDLLSQKYGDTLVEQGGLQVYTSLDLDVQTMAENILRTEVDKVKFLHITNGAVLVTDPQTGEILAMVGSRDYFDTQNDGNVNATLALRQPGSSIKPVNYSVALGSGFTAATVIPDTPISYRVAGQPPYTPVNYDGRFHGNVTLRTALASSYNVPAVKVLAAVGVNRMIDQGKKLGITTWDDPGRFGLSLTLGGGEVRMVDMATVYGTLANGGNRVDLQPILRVSDSHGNNLEQYFCTSAVLPPPSPHSDFLTDPSEIHRGDTNNDCPKQSVMDPGIAYILTDILSDNAARTPAFGPNSDLVISGHTTAVKTGTTNSMKDNWTIGYTPNILVATWVGNFDGSPMSYVASGVTGASPIWHKVMTKLLDNIPNTSFPTPGDIVKTDVCSQTGTLTCDACPVKRTEIFLSGTQPTRACVETDIRKAANPPKKEG